MAVIGNYSVSEVPDYKKGTDSRYLASVAYVGILSTIAYVHLQNTIYLCFLVTDVQQTG